MRISIHSLNAQFHTPYWIGKISNNKVRKIRPSPFFSFSAECVSWCWVNRLDWKKKKLKRNTRSLRIEGPGTPGWREKFIHIFGLTKCTMYCEKCSCFCSCFFYAVTMLTFQIKRIISRENGLTICRYFFFFFFFGKCQKFGSIGRR